jgi:hypothetical protein
MAKGGSLLYALIGIVVMGSIVVMLGTEQKEVTQPVTSIKTSTVQTTAEAVPSDVLAALNAAAKQNVVGAARYKVNCGERYQCSDVRDVCNREVGSYLRCEVVPTGECDLCFSCNCDNSWEVNCCYNLR